MTYRRKKIPEVDKIVQRGDHLGSSCRHSVRNGKHMVRKKHCKRTRTHTTNLQTCVWWYGPASFAYFFSIAIKPIVACTLVPLFRYRARRPNRSSSSTLVLLPYQNLGQLPWKASRVMLEIWGFLPCLANGNAATRRTYLAHWNRWSNINSPFEAARSMVQTKVIDFTIFDVACVFHIEFFYPTSTGNLG
jgi:hypothetical protein